MKMKICFIGFAMILSAALCANGQNTVTLGGEVERTGIEVQIDSSLYGRDIFSALPLDVIVEQPQAVRSALNAQVEKNDAVNFSGFRIRIYLGSDRKAREASADAIARFNAKYPYVQAYRTYSAPNFKVSVGNFRTRVDAEVLLNEIKGDFPEAFIVRERFKYPSLGRPDLRAREEVEPLADAAL